MPLCDQENLNPLELLETLHGYSFLAGYSLALMSPKGHFLAFRGKKIRLCDDTATASRCGLNCRAEMERAISDVLTSLEPRIFRCPLGLLKAIVPLRVEQDNAGYLICQGVREKLVDLGNLRPLLNVQDACESLISEWEKLPTVTREEIATVAEKTQKLLASLLEVNFSTFALQKSLNRLNAVAGITEEIDRVGSEAELIDILDETLSILFDVPRLAYILPSPSREGHFEVISARRGPMSSEKLTVLHHRQNGRPTLLRDASIRESLDYLGDIRQVYSIPFVLEGEALGHMFLCDLAPYPHDIPLIDLLAGRVSAKLLHLKRQRDIFQQKAMSAKLLESLALLSQCRSPAELYRTVLEQASNLLEATKGSVMLLDGAKKTLKIETALGMNPQLAQRLKVQVGGSFAGRVATKGTPLVVENIEKQSELSCGSRPRFKTKSFISFPLKNADLTVGVLNLSDKRDGGFFTEADVRLLSALTASFGGLLRGVTAQEQVGHLEELSMTDPLTGLHNRRFLQQRMEEELSRGLRQRLTLAVMMIDLDFFKKYNDLCGHLAGDKALERVAGILRQSSRAMDVVTRFGGEEFCILLPGASKDETVLVAQRIHAAIGKESFSAEELLPLGRLTTSIGIAFFPRDGTSARELINAADTALYAAKAEGRNRIKVHEPDSPPEPAGREDRLAVDANGASCSPVKH